MNPKNINGLSILRRGSVACGPNVEDEEKQLLSRFDSSGRDTEH